MSCPQFGYNGSTTTTQLLMAGQSAAGQPLHGSGAAGAGTGSGAGATAPGSGTGPGQPCCESGRPVLTDPLTGQTVCSCQYDAQLLSYQRLAATTGLPLNVYGSAAAAAAAAAAAYGGGAGGPEQGFLPLSAEQSAFYSPTANGFDLKDNLEAWRSLPYAASMYYPYESAALAGYPFPNGYGVDLNGARRKNATRETTSTLKAWLNEHRKNPYPTKGEKIMLAIITKMTLTQVSTWFANARRRLKKENKMTWSPRNRCDDDDVDADQDDSDRKDDNKSGSNIRNEKDMDSDIRRRRDSADKNVPDTRQIGSDDGKNEFVDVDDDCKSCASTSTDGHLINSSDKENLGIKPRVPSPISDASLASDSESSQNSPMLQHHHHSQASSEIISSTPQQQQQQKPRIWSIVDTATSSGPSSSLHSPPPGASSHRLSPLQRAAYLSPYPKPSSWYAGTLGNLGVVTSGGFPLSAVYSCPPIVSSMTGSVVSAAGGSESSAAAVSSLNRLRTAAAVFPSAGPPTAEMSSLHKAAAVAAAAAAAAAAASSSASSPTAANTPSVFNLSTKIGPGSSSVSHPGVSQHHPSSGSAAAIAAMAAGNGSLSSSLPSQGRVIS